MKINYIEGDLLLTDCEVIAHQVNSQGVMGSGVAKAIRERWPEVYQEYYNSWKSLNGDIFGGELFVKTHDGKYIANICAQYYYRGVKSEFDMMMKTDAYRAPQLISGNDVYSGVPLRFTNYEALFRGLLKTKKDMQDNNLISIAFPYKMGADRGGGDWDIVFAMIQAVFRDTDFIIEIRKK